MINKSLVEVQEYAKNIPGTANIDYEDFLLKYKKEVYQSLTNIFLNQKNQLYFNLEEGDDKKQNGILFSFYEQNYRANPFYRGKIWDDINKRKEFYFEFNLYKIYFKTTIIDFLLYTKKLLIPSVLKIQSIREDTYSANDSSFGNLKLPLIDVSSTLSEIKQLKKYAKTKFDAKFDDIIKYLANAKNDQNLYKEIEDNYGKKTLRKLDDLYLKLSKKLEIIEKNVSIKLYTKIEENLKASAVDIENINKDIIVKAVVMHSFSIYAKNLIIFSSGTYNNVSGLVFSSKYKGENWNNILNNKEVISYLDGKLRQITTFEIIEQEKEKEKKFKNDYEERCEKYNVLNKIVVAILSSIDATTNEKVHKIESRIKDYKSLYKKIRNRDYEHYYNKEQFNKLFFELEDKAQKLTLNELKKDKAGKIDKDMITDFLGTRIIFYDKKESIQFCENHLYKYFNIYEKEDKSKITPYKPGYESIHFIMSIKEEIINLFGGNTDKYAKVNLASMVFELQVRTILQHGWAYASHDFYKEGNIHQSMIKELTDASVFIGNADEKLSNIRNVN